MAACGVSQAKVDRVLDEFKKEGLIQSIPRKGIFKTDRAEASSLIPLIDLIYCARNEDYKRQGTFNAELLEALGRQAALRHQGVRMYCLPNQSSEGDIQALAGKPNLHACIFMGLSNPAIPAAFERHQVSWISLFPESGTTMPRSILIRPEEVVGKQLEHLRALGHSRIAFMHTVDDHFHRDKVFRREMFYRLMAEHGLQVRPNWVSYADYSEAPFLKTFASLLEVEPRPTAVIMPDLRLPWAYRVLQEKGLQVGTDISLVGTDDLHIASCLSPSATTLRVPRDTAAEMALAMLDDIVEGKAEEAPRYLPVELIVRQSTGPAPKA